MMFKIFANVAILLATIACAAPTTRDDAIHPANKLVLRDSENYCGNSSFTGQTTGGSPSVSDCQQIATNIAGGGVWTLTDGSQHQLLQYGSCAFGATQTSFTGIVQIGNQDIIDLIDSSVQYSWNDLISMEGDMSCAVEAGMVTNVNWGLYYNN
ncbi:uncharacterized protein PFLUO_LOCUS3827 [Penicillium psychrofluorescens]|uniref:uncharacterized protein n=1 Tax=Penicillium psychrofluorescens TaxID=3158075 RepID=UPI003CCD32CC